VDKGHAEYAVNAIATLFLSVGSEERCQAGLLQNQLARQQHNAIVTECFLSGSSGKFNPRFLLDGE
jgi:hypothetical protein